MVSEPSETMRRIEEMLATLMAERRAPPTPDPPDSFRTRQISAHHLQPINHEGQIYLGNQATRYEFPKFNGTLISDWIWRCDQLFFLNRTPPELMVHQASLHFEGKALQWHHEYIRNRYGRYPSWPEYIIDISAHYGRNWDVDIVDCNGRLGSTTLNDGIDWDMHRVVDLKEEYRNVYTPMVINVGNQMCRKLPKPSSSVIEGQETTQVETKSASTATLNDEMTATLNDEVEPIVAIGSTVPSAHQVFDKMSAQNESMEIEVSDYLNEPLDLAVSQMKVHEKREVMHEFSRLEAPQMLEEMQEEPSGLVVCLPFDERLGLMEKGIGLLEVFPKEIMSAERAVSPNKGQSALMSFDPGGKWPPISAKCEIKEVASMSDGDPNQIDEGLMLNPSFLSINQPRLRSDGLLGISPGIEKCIELPTSDLDLKGALSCVDSLGCHGSFNEGDELLCFDPGGEELLFETKNGSIVSKSKLIALFNSQLNFDPGGRELLLPMTDLKPESTLLPRLDPLTGMRKVDINLGFDRCGARMIVFGPRGSLVVSKALSSPITIVDSIVDLLILIGVESAIYSVGMSLGNLGDSSSLKLVANMGELTAATKASNSVQLVFDPGGKEGTSHELALSMLKLYILSNSQQSAQNYDGAVIDKIAMPKQIAKGDQEDTKRVISCLKPKRTLLLLLLDPPKEMSKLIFDIEGGTLLIVGCLLDLLQGVDKELFVLSITFATKLGDYHVLKQFKIVSLLNSGDKQLLTVTLIGMLILSLAFLSVYNAYQIVQSWVQERRIQYSSFATIEVNCSLVLQALGFVWTLITDATSYVFDPGGKGTQLAGERVVSRWVLILKKGVLLLIIGDNDP